MNTGFNQCEARTTEGVRCRRLARPGSKYCHSHRDYRPKTKETLPDENRLAEHLFDCVDCGHLIPLQGQRIVVDNPDMPGAKQIICEPCFRLRKLIEERISELCSLLGTIPRKKVHEDLALFGVDPDLVDAAITRMLKDERIKEVPSSNKKPESDPASSGPNDNRRKSLFDF